VTPGRVIVLNGPSSAGKTTVAKAFQDIAGQSCLVLSIDQLFASVHRDRIHDWALFESLTNALAASAFSFAASGLLVVVDTLFERPDCRRIFVDASNGQPWLLVGLSCALEVLEEREKHRGDRPHGLARRQSGHVHDGCTYDLMLDTSEGTASGHAARLYAALSAATQSGAVER
jgi:chloramphenicol 3-O phosphotransferase